MAAVAAPAALAAAAPSAAAPFTGTAAVANGRVTFAYTFTASTVPVAVASFASDEPSALPADATSASGLTVDGAAPATPATVAGKDVTVDLGALTTATHTVAFSVPLPAGTPSGLSAKATVDLDGTVTPSSDVPVVLPSADLGVAFADDGFGGTEGGTFTYAGFGVDDSDDLTVSNRGPQASSPVLLLDLPAGLVPGEDGITVGADEDENADGRPITCASSAGAQTGGTLFTCPLGALAANGTTDVEVDLKVTAAGKPGSSGQWKASIAPADGAPADPVVSNNSVSYPVLFTGTARLTLSTSALPKSLPLGRTTTVTVSIHNAGPQTAKLTLGFVGVGAGALNGDNDSDADVPSPLSIVGFDGNSTPPGELGGTDPFQRHRVSGHVVPAVVHAAAGDPASGGGELDGNARFWSAGDIPAGGTARAHLTVKAVHLGVGSAVVLGFSAAGNPGCNGDLDLGSISPCFAAGTTTTVVAAPPAPSSTPTPVPPSTQGTGSGSGTSLANTGSPSLPLLLTGLGLVLAGGVLTRAGRRRTA